MRVLIWGNCYPRIGGVETFVANLANAFVERSIEVAVLTDGPRRDRIDELAFPIWTVPMDVPVQGSDPVAIVESIRAIKTLIADYRPDVIHYNMSGPEVLLFLWVMQSCPVPVVLTLHNTTLFDLKTGSPGRLVDRCAAITAVSAFVRSVAIAGLGAIAGEIDVIVNAIPTPPAAGEPASSRDLVAVGRIVPEKGFDTLVQAFAMVLPQHPDARLTIHGNGSELGALTCSAESLGIAGSVRFAGWIEQSKVHAAIAAAAIVAMPSRWAEPFGLVALEAGHAARPCIASRVGALPSIIVDGVTGLLVPADDPARWASALTRLFEDPAGAGEMGRRAKERMHSHYRFDAMADAYLAKLQGACGLS